MRLTSYTDYSLRVLLYLGAHRDRLCSVAEISRAYGISQNHLMKVVNGLGRLGYVSSTRGRTGGIRLGRSADQICVGKVVRETEDEFDLVDCQHCLISSACGLACVLDEALAAFMAVLDRYTLDDLLARRADLLGLFLPSKDWPQRRWRKQRLEIRAKSGIDSAYFRRYELAEDVSARCLTMRHQSHSRSKSLAGGGIDLPHFSLVPSELPAGLEIYARSPDFTPRTLPAVLKRSHYTADGVWGGDSGPGGRSALRSGGTRNGLRHSSRGRKSDHQTERASPSPVYRGRPLFHRVPHPERTPEGTYTFWHMLSRDGTVSGQ